MIPIKWGPLWLAIPYGARGYPRSGLETGDQQQQTSAALTEVMDLAGSGR